MCLSLECYEYSEAVFVSQSIQSVGSDKVEEERYSTCVIDVVLLPPETKKATPREFPHMVRPNFLLTL